MRLFALLVPLSLITLAPLAHATTLPACTDESVAAAGGFYLSDDGGASVWSEFNGVPGLQTHDCLDMSGRTHHADVEEAATSGHKQIVCVTGQLCFWVPA